MSNETGTRRDGETATSQRVPGHVSLREENRRINAALQRLGDPVKPWREQIAASVHRSQYFGKKKKKNETGTRRDGDAAKEHA